MAAQTQYLSCIMMERKQLTRKMGQSGRQGAGKNVLGRRKSMSKRQRQETSVSQWLALVSVHGAVR